MLLPRRDQLRFTVTPITFHMQALCERSTVLARHVMVALFKALYTPPSVSTGLGTPSRGAAMPVRSESLTTGLRRSQLSKSLCTMLSATLGDAGFVSTIHDVVTLMSTMSTAIVADDTVDEDGNVVMAFPVFPALLGESAER